MQHDKLFEIECEMIDLAGLADAVLLSVYHFNDHNGRGATAEAELAANALPVMARTLKERLETAHDRILELAGESNPETGGSPRKPNVTSDTILDGCGKS